MTKKEFCRIGGYIIDAICFVLTITLTIIDKFYLMILIDNYQNLFVVSSNIITILLPTITTIISISLSLTKEKIYGITINEFNTLRGQFYYSFLHIVLLMCGIIGIYSILYIINAKITMYFLSFVAILYSIYFLIQEIPLLVNSRWLIKHVLKKRFKRRGASNLLMSQKNETIFNRIVENILLTEGIITDFDVLKSKDNTAVVLKYLLDIQNNYYRRIIENMPSESSYFLDFSKDVSVNIQNAINVGYDNIIELLSNNDFNYYNIANNKDIYNITWSLFSLHKICEKLTIENKEQLKINEIINGYISSCLFKCDKNPVTLSVIISMCAKTIYDGETWFIERLRDNYFYSGCIFDFNDCVIGIFISMMIVHLFDHNILPADKKERLKLFLVSPSEGINSNGNSWIENVKQSLNSSNFNAVAKSIIDFIKYFKSVDESTFYFYKNRTAVVHDSSDDFSIYSIMDQWIGILLYVSELNGEESKIDSVISELDNNDKDFLINCLSNKWLIDDKLNENAEASFIKTLFDDDLYKFTNNYSNSSLISNLVYIHDQKYKKDVDNTIESAKNDLEEDKIMILDAVKKSIKENVFFDNELSLKDNNEMKFEFSIKAFEYKSILNSYLKQLPYFLINIIVKEIKNVVNSTTRFSFLLKDEDAKKILKYNPKYTTEINIIEYYCLKGKYSNKIKKLELINVGNIPLKLYFRKGSIKFNAIISEDKTIVRRLSYDEIEKIIRRDYQPFENGLYRFSEYNSEKNYSFFVTKEELHNYLQKQIIVVSIVFQIVININKKHCLLFNIQTND